MQKENCNCEFQDSQWIQTSTNFLIFQKSTIKQLLNFNREPTIITVDMKVVRQFTWNRTDFVYAVKPAKLNGDEYFRFLLCSRLSAVRNRDFILGKHLSMYRSTIIIITH